MYAVAVAFSRGPLNNLTPFRISACDLAIGFATCNAIYLIFSFSITEAYEGYSIK